ncbi:energy transducer TonB [Sphaerospermopsis kisseleviana CS-549]|uniref:Energy transducer TonB n=1 Tax=Sphaerospermopsis kisseleviana CS-549 TaxID=3021783 RepID=A0ABT4ZTJ4_9CYAN|nr:energy transducer TonB [Sphaerospermopsis kisseleviana]MDB9442743.1 energy transducer TonB [Sphaerospermopsis kisseleviana CS-549]
MGFSIVIVEQREKEAKALKSFLFCSLIASLVFHIGVLALGIGKFIQRVSQTQEEPIEITIVETVPEIIAKPQEIKNSQPKINSASGGSGGNNNFKSSLPEKTTLSVSNAAIQPVVKQTQLKTTQNFVVKQRQTLTIPEKTITQPSLTTTPITKTIPEPTTTQPSLTTTPIAKTIPEPTTTQPSLTTTPISKITEKITEKVETETTTQPTVEQPEQTVIPDTKLSNVPAPKLITPSSVSVSSNNTFTTSSSQNSLSNLGNRLRSGLSKGTENGTGNGEGSGTGDGIGNSAGKGTGNGTGNGIGNGAGKGTGNGIGNGERNIAIAPKPRPVNGTKLNRADCIRCDIKYPDKARRRGIEGRAEVALDTDINGNVTFVRLIRSSGDSELDEAAQQAVQEWKLTPLDGGRQGVTASINFAIQGSQRHRQIKERQRERQREASQPKPKITNPQESTSSLEPVKSDTENQVDESKTQEVTPPDSTSSESNSDSENN